MTLVRRYLLFGISLVLIVIALIAQFQAAVHPEYNLYIHSGLLISMALLLMLIFKLKDNWMKLFIFFSLILFGFSFFFFNSQDQYHYWFIWASLLACLGYILILIAGRRRNFKSMELSTMRRHPWISAIIMAGGLFLFKDIEVYLSGKKLALIVLTVTAIITSLVVIERNKQVHPRSFIFLLLGLLMIMSVHALQLHYLFHRTPDIVPYIMTIFTGLAAVFMVIGTVCYEDRLIPTQER